VADPVAASVQGAPAIVAKIKKAYPRLCAEASSLTTAPARLELLAQREPPVGPLAQRNPNLPGKRLRTALVEGRPGAWDNPGAALALWDVSTKDVRAGAMNCAYELARQRSGVMNMGAHDVPYPVSEQMRKLLRGPLEAGWWDEADELRFVRHVARYARSCGTFSRQHQEVALVLLGLSHRPGRAEIVEEMAGFFRSLTDEEMRLFGRDHASDGRVSERVRQRLFRVQEGTLGRMYKGLVLALMIMDPERVADVVLESPSYGRVIAAFHARPEPLWCEVLAEENP